MAKKDFLFLFALVILSIVVVKLIIDVDDIQSYYYGHHKHIAAHENNLEWKVRWHPHGSWRFIHYIETAIYKIIRYLQIKLTAGAKI